MEQIIKNPKNIKDLAEEIKKVCDAYWKKEMTEKEAKKYISYWKSKESEKLFKDKKINSTISKIIGQKRKEMLNKWLEEI